MRSNIASQAGAVSRQVRYLSIALVALGLLQTFGYMLRAPRLRSFAGATVASPVPLLFSHFKGLEAFSSSYRVVATTVLGDELEVIISPMNYKLVDGPLNRRSVYGAVAAYGAALDQPSEVKLVSEVLKYGLCRGPLSRVLHLQVPLAKGALHVDNQHSQPPLEAILEVTCVD